MIVAFDMGTLLIIFVQIAVLFASVFVILTIIIRYLYYIMNHRPLEHRYILFIFLNKEHIMTRVVFYP